MTITLLELSFCVTASFLGSAGISTCYPSPTTLVLGLGPDLPWADEPSPGNLGLSTGMFLACLSLLIPAFSLVQSPPFLSVRLQPLHIAPLPPTAVIPIPLVSLFAFGNLPASLRSGGMMSLRFAVRYTDHSGRSVASVSGLSPGHLRRTITRPVSYYALFKCVAASKPTSWLSVQFHILLHLT